MTRQQLLNSRPHALRNLSTAVKYGNILGSYWHHCCAVCGVKFNSKHSERRVDDHWIALTDPRPNNPGTVPHNLICLCRTCNSSKWNKDPIQWLKSKFDEPTVSLILQRIETYFEWVRQQ